MQTERLEADILMATDYYPFGMAIPERQWYTGSDSSNYRYGFNGMENDREYGVTGNYYDYGFRIYNPAIGKFLSIDPLFMTYPYYSPYNFAGNNPIRYIDLDGLESQDPQSPESKDDGGVEAANPTPESQPNNKVNSDSGSEKPASTDNTKSGGDPIKTSEDVNRRFSKSFQEVVKILSDPRVAEIYGITDTKEGVQKALELAGSLANGLKVSEGGFVGVAIRGRASLVDPKLIEPNNPEGEVRSTNTGIVLLVPEKTINDLPTDYNPGVELIYMPLPEGKSIIIVLEIQPNIPI